MENEQNKIVSLVLVVSLQSRVHLSVDFPVPQTELLKMRW